MTVEFAHLANASQANFCLYGSGGVLPNWQRAGMANENSIRDLREARGLTLEQLADLVGLSVSYVSRLEKGGRNLSVRHIDSFAEAFGVPRERLLATGTVEADVGRRIPLSSQPLRGGRPDLAVRGIALGGGEGDGDFSLNGDALQYIERPAGLIRSPRAFAIILRNTSMEPVYRHGWPIFVDPDGRKPVDGEDVLIELHGEDEQEAGPAFIKTLVGRRGGRVWLKQYNPPPDGMDFPIERVKQILRVIPYPEAMGLSV